MPDYDVYADMNEARRAHALEEALSNLDVTATDEEIIARAEMFEEYLKNGAEGVAAREKATAETYSVEMVQPPAKAVREPLPEPKHHGYSGADGTCLGCEWITLKRKIRAAESDAR